MIRHLGVLFTFTQSKDISKSSMSATFEGLVFVVLELLMFQEYICLALNFLGGNF